MPSLPSPRTRPSRPASVGRRLGAVLAVVSLALAGCGLRLETPPPAPLVPDAVETVRQRATADALALAVLAGRTETEDESLAAVLSRVAEASAAHLDSLGGLYDPGTDEPDDPQDEDAPTTPSPVPPSSTPQDLLDLLERTAANARQDAVAVTDGPMARLLASVGTSRLLLADALARSADLEAEAVATFEVPQEMPAGVPSSDVAILVRSEDAAGFAWEVMAARSSDDARRAAARRAQQHRERAEAWAELDGLAGTGLDPRRNTYALPVSLTGDGTDPQEASADLATVEAGLAASYASVLARAEADARQPLVDALADAAREHARLASTTPIFPGLPEHGTAEESGAGGG